VVMVVVVGGDSDEMGRGRGRCDTVRSTVAGSRHSPAAWSSRGLRLGGRVRETRNKRRETRDEGRGLARSAKGQGTHHDDDTAVSDRGWLIR
jgi:hypothetical protein